MYERASACDVGSADIAALFVIVGGASVALLATSPRSLYRLRLNGVVGALPMTQKGCNVPTQAAVERSVSLICTARCLQRRYRTTDSTRRNMETRVVLRMSCGYLLALALLQCGSVSGQRTTGTLESNVDGKQQGSDSQVERWRRKRVNKAVDEFVFNIRTLRVHIVCVRLLYRLVVCEPWAVHGQLLHENH